MKNKTIIFNIFYYILILWKIFFLSNLSVNNKYYIFIHNLDIK